MIGFLKPKVIGVYDSLFKKQEVHLTNTVHILSFNCLGGLFFSGPFEERAYWRRGLISWWNYMIIFLQHKEMCVKRLCILTILTQLPLNVLRCSIIYQLVSYIYVLRCSWHVWCVMLFLRKWKQISWYLFRLKLHIILLIRGGGLNKYLNLKRGRLIWEGGLFEREELKIENMVDDFLPLSVQLQIHSMTC